MALFVVDELSDLRGSQVVLPRYRGIVVAEVQLAPELNDGVVSCPALYWFEDSSSICKLGTELVSFGTNQFQILDSQGPWVNRPWRKRCSAYHLGTTLA